jgi:Glutamate dehydrogenase, C-terminal
VMNSRLIHFSENIDNHRLKRNIIATQIANDLVNHTGLTFVHCLNEATDNETVQEKIDAWVTQCTPCVERWKNFPRRIKISPMQKHCLFLKVTV